MDIVDVHLLQILDMPTILIYPGAFDIYLIHITSSSRLVCGCVLMCPSGTANP